MAANTKRDRSENDSRACATHETVALREVKVFRYSFFGTIPYFLNRLLDSLHLVGST